VAKTSHGDIDNVHSLLLISLVVRPQINKSNRIIADIGVLIEFVPTARISFFNLARIKRHIEQFTNKPVDLLTPEAISRFFRDQISYEAETVYER